MSESEEVLCSKRICRFCMTQEEPLTNIYAKDSRLENAVPLPLQIMACVSIEVFNNDGMPNTICGPCRILMDRSYRFKQICKQSDGALRQFTVTGVWPEPIPLPDDIAETINLSDRKRYTSESGDFEPSPKRTKTYIELQPVKSRNPQKSSSKRVINPMILNTRVSQASGKVSKLVKIARKRNSSDEETDQYILKEEFDQKPEKKAFPVQTDVFPCEHCDRSFPLKQLLDIHMRHHTRERNYKCGLCSKRFFSKYDLGKHMTVHSGLRPFSCVACNKTFARATLLHRHEKIHVDTPKFLCNSCDKTFLSLDELDRHERNHKKRRPFACTQCNKRFAFKQGLDRHEVIHASNKPFNCHYCDEGFTTPGKLARHVTAHAGARPYPCKLCTKSFLLSHHLTRHLKSHTPGHIPSTHYKCDECEKVFLRKDDLIYHSAVHATENLTCPLCKDKFEDIDTVTEHIKSHTEGEQYPCEFCDLIFTSQERVLTHTENVHVDGQDVKQELEQYDDNENENENSVTDEFPCDYCDLVFMSQDRLLTHVELKHDDEQKKDDQNENSVVGTFEDPLELLNSITKSNKEKKKKDVQNLTPVRRSQRSGKVRDYAKMVKSDDDSDEEDNEGEIAKKLIRQMKTYSSPTKILNKGSAKSEKIGPKIGIKKIEHVKKIVKGYARPDTDKKLVQKTDEPKSPMKQKAVVLNKSVAKISEQVIAKKPKILNKSATSEIDLPESSHKSDSTINNTLDVLNTSSENEISAPTPVKLTQAPQLIKVPRPKSEIVQMKIGDKMVKVQKILMSKSQVEAMARQGKIEMKGGAMLLKQGPKLGKALASTIGAEKPAENILPN